MKAGTQQGRVAASADTAAKLVTGALTRLRRPRIGGFPAARILHPDGIGFSAELQIEPDGDAPWATLLGQPGRHHAVVRLSRALGLPSWIPDALGVAIRVPDVAGPGQHQDLLLVSSGKPALARHAILPGVRGFFGTFFTSLVPYRIGDEALMVGLDPGQGPASPYGLESTAQTATGRSFCLCVAPPLGDWRPVGTLMIDERLPDENVEALRFRPWNTAGGLRPLGPLMRLRERAYEGSQDARRDGNGRG